MKPPADRRLPRNGDLPLTAPAAGRVPPRVVVLTAVGLALLSTLLAWQFTRLAGLTSMTVWRLALLNVSWWGLWAAMTPLVIWLSRRFRIERGRLRAAMAAHLPAVAGLSVLHIAGMEVVQWWLAEFDGRGHAWWASLRRTAVLYFDWEMMTYWAVVGATHAHLYYVESRARAVRTVQLEARLVQAQLSALQQQLSPHFLFNTLHSISALMHTDVAAAERMLMQLSDLLRTTLDHLGRQEVTLEEEVAALSKYLEIEQARFGERLAVRFDVQPDALHTLIPSLLLQPLVENAVKHGIGGRAGAGLIEIAARRDGDKLRLEVRDDGVGLSESALTALEKGIGVSTTRSRLQHLFGAGFRFEFHRLPRGLAVVVALPWRLGAARHADDEVAERGTGAAAGPVTPGIPRPFEEQL